MEIEPAAVELYWIPLGAGAHCVKLSGRLFEAVQARAERREARRLFHSALVVRLDGQVLAKPGGKCWYCES